jgi:hypothetical protein
VSEHRSPAASAAGSEPSSPYRRCYPEWNQEAWSYRSTIAWLTLTPAGGTKTLDLWTESHGRRTRHSLVTSSDPFALVTLDGAAVLATASPLDQVQQWVAFSTEQGQKLGQATLPPGVQEISVFGSRVYWLAGTARGRQEDLTLNAADLASGSALWHLNAGTRANPVSQSRRQ